MSLTNSAFTIKVPTPKKNSGNGMPMENHLPSDLARELTQALHAVGGYGSIEIYVQDHSVTQITVRQIKKTKHYIAE